MMNKFSLFSSSIYLSLLSSFTWAETSTEVLQTIQLQAETEGGKPSTKYCND